MADQVKCPNGHWYRPKKSADWSLCPHCKAKSHLRSDSQISDDDVLAILGPPIRVDLSDLPPEEPEYEPEVHLHTLQRRKKICPVCYFETSLSFGHCPRCGGVLEIALTKAF